MVSGHMSQGDLNSNLLPNTTFPIVENFAQKKNSKKIKKNQKNSKKIKKIQKISKNSLTRIYTPLCFCPKNKHIWSLS